MHVICLLRCQKHIPTRLCWAFSVNSQCDATHICCWALVPADCASSSRSISSTRTPAGHSAANDRPLLIDGTDRWSDHGALHRSCSTYYVGSVNNATDFESLLNRCYRQFHILKTFFLLVWIVSWFIRLVSTYCLMLALWWWPQIRCQWSLTKFVFWFCWGK